MLLKDNNGQNKRVDGTFGEDLVADYVGKRGYKILERNFFCKFAEIDIIAEDADGRLIFIEVKERNSNRFGSGREAVDARKMHKMQSACMYYKKTVVRKNNPVRFDLAEVNNGKVTYIENIF